MDNGHLTLLWVFRQNRKRNKRLNFNVALHTTLCVFEVVNESKLIITNKKNN
jgi:hypothetical protein